MTEKTKANLEQARTTRQPLRKPNCQISLPDIYEQYLSYHEQSRQVPHRQIKCIRRVLVPFHEYLERSKIRLSSLTIERLDAFLAEFTEPFAPATGGIYRGYLRGFLSYLYHERQILKRDLGPMLIAAPMFSQAKPPKFLRPHEVQRLFDSLEICSAKELRTLLYFSAAR